MRAFSNPREKLTRESVALMHVLLVVHEDQKYPVCSTDWIEAWNDVACQQMAYGYELTQDF